MTGNKLRLGQYLATRGIATPPSLRVIPSQGLPADFRYPAVLKPIDGAGSQDTYFVRAAGRFPEQARAMPEALLQPLVQGVAHSASFLVGRDGRAHLIAAGRQHIEIREDRFCYRGGTVPVPLQDAKDGPRRAIESVAGLGGFVGVDYIWDARAKRATVLEINPRPTTSYVGLARWLPPGMSGAGVAPGGPRDGDSRRARLDFPERRPQKRGDLRGRRWDDQFRRRSPPMTESDESWMALDIGGANIKATHTAGPARTLPFELWKRPDDLRLVLAALAATFPACDRVALTMTAELCDCYPTKQVGVNAVLDAVLDAFPRQAIAVWGVDGHFHDVSAIQRQPALAAASNWLALATLVARLVSDDVGLLIDIGTTTTDLIPLDHGQAAARGRTDTERLQNGELVYAGIRRTPVCALATELSYRDIPTGLAAELFASTLDIYLTLDEIPADAKDLSTADGRPATKAASRDRLARMIGTDRDTFTDDDALAFAQAADDALLARLESAAARACRATIGHPRFAIVAGSGEFLARRLAQRIIEPGGTILGLNKAWGPVASSAGCATPCSCSPASVSRVRAPAEANRKLR